ncbi:DUF262 domain-containing protein [uncultured Corynebacterium sp.]|uniref:DUF262 domain-containing protein n=1 Tax=uncultured Corynebacterium sp. TaxID=159447 RepID=UPI0025FE5B76|nr:DUF262 domain-containing protein [uncultured Corynebacterium sp.]
MKGQVVGIYKVFDGSEKKIVIPVYQRNYDWTPKQCDRLFDDLEEMITMKRSKHFFGAVVGDPEDSFTWVVIDGQQRMTTVSLLILALVHAIQAGDIEPGDPTLAGKLMRNYLEFREGSEQKFKLKPVKDDRSSYAKLFGPEEHFNEKSKITVNYRYFRNRLRKTGLDAATLWNEGISNLEVMLLDLEKEDDPQRIFESINSTGLALKESDKIRNFILMGLSQREQNEIYENYWNEMEKNVSFATDSFIRWYLVAQTSKTPKESDVFEAFKYFAKKSGLRAVDIAKDLFRFSTYARDLEKASTGFSEIDRRLKRAHAVLGDVIKPFLWLSYRDVKDAVLAPEDFAALIALLETYIFRRVISNVPANALNKIFPYAYSELRKLRKNNERYADVMAYMLINRGQSARFPDDEEFAEAAKTRDVYRMRPVYRAYLFDVMERGESKDVVDIAAYIEKRDLTIEHIMPQTLTKQWRADLGPDAEAIHSVWVNRAANLTITGYNSEYSNLPFEQKLTRADGFKSSPYALNSYIKEQTEWGLEQLEERSDLLAQRALELWPFPEVTFEPEKEVLPFEPLGVDTSFKGKAIVAIEVEGVKTPCPSWADMIVTALRALLEVNRDAVLSVVPESTLLIDSNISGTVAKDRKWRQVDPALGVFVGKNTDSKINLLRKVCEAANYDPDEILFFLRPAKEEEDTENDVGPQSPFADLLALKPLVDEIEGTALSENETWELRSDLKSALIAHPVSNPLAALSGMDLQTFLAHYCEGEITVDQALACLNLFEQTAQLMGQGVWHQALLSGQVGKLLGALEPVR